MDSDGVTQHEKLAYQRRHEHQKERSQPAIQSIGKVSAGSAAFSQIDRQKGRLPGTNTDLTASRQAFPQPSRVAPVSLDIGTAAFCWPGRTEVLALTTCDVGPRSPETFAVRRTDRVAQHQIVDIWKDLFQEEDIPGLRGAGFLIDLAS